MSDSIRELNDNELIDITGGYSEPCFVYVIKKGDCLSTLACRYNTTIQKICELNNILSYDCLYEGNKLLIPLSGNN